MFQYHKIFFFKSIIITVDYDSYQLFMAGYDQKSVKKIILTSIFLMSRTGKDGRKQSFMLLLA